MNLTRFSLQNRVVTWMFILLIALGGRISYDQLGRLEDPAFTIKEAVVFTSYPGASAQEVEQEVTDILETAIRQMDQIKRIRSISRAGISEIHAEMKDKYDGKTLPQVWSELRHKVSDARIKLPPGASEPLVNDDFGDVFGVFYAITGDGFDLRELQNFADFLKREMLLVQDVASVDIMGRQDEAIYVEFSNQKLSLLGISQQQIFDTLKGYDGVASAGEMPLGKDYIRIAPTGTFQSVDEIRSLLIQGTEERLIRLGDLATVSRGYVEPAESLMHFNGKQAIGLGISTVSGGNVVVMGKAVTQRLEELQERIPIGINLNTIAHQGDSVEIAVNGFVENLVQALVIVIGVLLLFMGLRSGLLIGVVLLLTVASTMIFMDIFSINLQRISLGALVIALGMLVDNAIVVTEGILVGIQTGKRSYDAAMKTVAETAWPLLGATVIAILAFSGIGLSQDSTGEFCRSLFQVILISLMLSWVLAVTATPLLCDIFLKAKQVDEDAIYDHWFFRAFKTLLETSIRFKYLVSILMAGLLVAAIFGFRYVPDSFFPNSNRPQFMINLWLPQGRHIQEITQVTSQVENWLTQQEKIDSHASFIGRGATRFILTYKPESSNRSYAQILVNMKKRQDIPEMIEKVEAEIGPLFPDITLDVQSFVLGPGGGGKIAVRLSGPDANVLRELTEQVKGIYASDPNTKAIRDDWRQRTKILRPVFDETAARRLGISRQQLSNALEWVMHGSRTALYREENKLIPIYSRLPEEEKGRVENARFLKILSPVTGKHIPLEQLILAWPIEFEDGLIHRWNQERTIKVECDPIFGVASNVFNRIRPKVESLKLPEGYHMEWAGEYEDSTKAKTSLGKNLPLSFLAMIVCIVFLFNKIRETLIILLTVPLAIIGVTAGLLSFMQAFDFMSLLGFLSLSGMLIKNSIVLLEQIDLEENAGREPYEALVHATITRIRPVAMAAVTTVLGMLPLIGDDFFRGLAITIMGGLSFATVLTLLVVPVLYAVFYRIRKPKNG